MALDKVKLSQSLSISGQWASGGPFPWSLVSDEPFTFDKLGPYYKYDPEAAKKLLIEAGYPDGKFKSPGPLIVSSPSALPFGQLVQQYYKQNGIEFDLRPIDTVEWLGVWYSRSHSDMIQSFWVTPDLALNWFAQNKFHSTSLQNTGIINDPSVDDLVGKIRITTDPAKLREYAKFLWSVLDGVKIRSTF